MVAVVEKSMTRMSLLSLSTNSTYNAGSAGLSFSEQVEVESVVGERRTARLEVAICAQEPLHLCNIEMDQTVLASSVSPPGHTL